MTIQQKAFNFTFEPRTIIQTKLVSEDSEQKELNEEKEVSINTDQKEISNINLFPLALSALVLLIFCNTMFLVFEQVDFYTLKGYPLWQAVFISVLCEVSVLFLSVCGNACASKTYKMIVKLVLFLSLAVLAGIINLGVEKKEFLESSKIQRLDLLKETLSTLKIKEQEALDEISSYDEVAYKKKRQNLLTQLNKGTREEIKLKSKQLEMDLLTSVGQSAWEIYLMKFLRCLALGWNVILIYCLKECCF